MPLTEKGEKIKAAMVEKYGPEKGKQVFYASKNKGTITGVDDDLSEKEHKTLKSMRERYGYEQGNRVFNRAKEKGEITDSLKPGWRIDIEFPNERSDDNRHMGFTSGEALRVEELVSDCDSLAQRMDAFEKRQHQRKPEKVKPRTKDYMQPSNPHPKEVK